MNSRSNSQTADDSTTAHTRALQPKDIYNPQFAVLEFELNQTHKNQPLTDQLKALQEELQNPLSLWQELRITAMSGTDYVFMPSFIYKAFGPSYTMTRFIAELSCVFNLEINRLQIVCITEPADENRIFSKGSIEWANGSISHTHEEPIAINSSYHTFIDSMYQHSTTLVDQLGH